MVLARAIETTDQEHQLLRADEIRQAGLSARNMGHLQGGGDAADAFLSRRAALLLDALERRMPALAAARRPYRITVLASWALPPAGLVAGALTERIANPHRMDLLSLPLLGVLAWNLLMYLVLLAFQAIPALRRRRTMLLDHVWKPAGGPRRRRAPAALASAIARFSGDWHRLAAPLNLARARRTLHLAAALFGAGIAASLYVRGLIVEYRVGWESTFLGAEHVHAILQVLFAPATWLFQLPGFSLADVAALRFDANGGQPGGARWVHSYAALLAVVVIIPRLLLAGGAAWTAARLRREFPLDVGQPYYRKLLGALSPVPLRLRIIPYSFSVDEERNQGLQAVARAMLGDTAQATVGAGWGYGTDPEERPPQDLAGEPATVTAALVNLSATPERENHGAFLDALARALPGKLVLMVDQSSYASRLAGQADATRRLEERKRLWQDFGRLHQVPVTVVDLLDPPADVR
ncbi:MAG: DUF2868 domain-containing protein [Pigmentiphaga sp.]|uniref:DUF2868 domain-containing protein n=1 Tax=Pigmentiphaga sp. TaxID=1977564 RepID=UPI0029A82391|nr:DUF2868 domain-containing protein [Pigmentiphaga sp.]MDX3905789.1 DUF2868 domain-containing protein [Pigmentiphaga sp.]